MLKPVQLCLSILFGVLGAAVPAFAQDLTPPTVGVVVPAGYSHVNSLAEVSGTAHDASGVSDVQLSLVRLSDEYYWDGAAYTATPSFLTASVSSLTWTYATLPAFVNGAAYSVSARALDLASNWSVVYSTAVFYYDSNEPVSDVAYPVSGSVISTFTGISGTAWDAESFAPQVWVRVIRAADNQFWNGAISQWTAAEAWNLSVGSVTWTYSGLAQGDLTTGATYFVLSRAADLAGNVQAQVVNSSTFVYTGAAAGAGFTGDFSQPGGAAFDGGADDAATDIAIDTVTFGGPYLYVLGYSSRGPTMDSLVVKYNSSGVLVSSAIFDSGFNDSPEGIAVDGSGNVFITGSGNACVTVKYDSTLVLQSTASYPACVAQDLAIDRAGNVFVAGSKDDNALVVKYDNNLLIQSTAVYDGGDADVAVGVAADASGNIFSVIGTPLNGAGGNYLTMKLSNSLVIQATAVYNGGFRDWPEAIAVDALGNVYVTGESGNGLDTDALTVKYNNALLFQSSAAYNGGADDSSLGAAADNLGNVYVAGWSGNGSDNDLLLLKYSSGLMLLSTAAYNGGAEDWAAGVAAGSSGYVYAAGGSGSGGDSDFSVLRSSMAGQAPQDLPPPAPVIIQPPHNSVVNSMPQLSGTAIDDVAVSSVVLSIRRTADGLFWDGAAWAASQTWLSAATTGYSWFYGAVPAWTDTSTYTVNARAMDSSGSWSAAYSTSTFVFNSALPSGCAQAFNVKLDGSMEYQGIQAALNALPQSLSGNACVVLRDAATYNEQVTVRNFANNGYRIKIMADPSFVSSAPAVSPPALSTAAFLIFNDSVTLQGINISPANPVAYGVLSSSAGLTLAGVNVAAGGNIFTAGVSLSSGSVISGSGIAVQDAEGVMLTGTLSSVGQSTITCDTSRYSALTFSGASSNTVTGSFLSNPNGRVVYVSTSANGNAIAQSVIASDSNAIGMFAALYVRASSSNTVSDTVINNPSGVAAYLGVGANYNSIIRSTMTSVSTGYQALRISGGAYNTVAGSYMYTTLGYALSIGVNSGSDYNTITQSTMASNSIPLSALYVYRASGNTVDGCVISNPSGDGAYLWDNSNNNTISRSSVTSNAAGKYAMHFSGSSGNQVQDSYLANPPGYGLQFAGGAVNQLLRSTVSVNSIYAAFTLDNSTGNTVSRSVISNPSGYGAFLGFGANHNTVDFSRISADAADYFAFKIQSSSFNIVYDNFISNPGGVAYTSVFGTGNVLGRSTVTSGAWPYSAVFIDASDYHGVSYSYIQGADALFVRDSTGTGVAYNVLAATNMAGTGLRLDNSAGLFSTANRISAGGTGTLINAGCSGVIAVTSDTVSGAARGFSADALADGGSLAMSGVIFESLAPGATAINFLGGTFVSTIAYATFNGTGPLVNVDGSLLAPGSAVTMRDYFGPRAGPAYETDPGNRVFWSAEDSAAPTAAILQPANNSFLNALGAVSGTAADGMAVSSVTVSVYRNDTGLFWDGAAWAAGQAWLNAAVFPSSWTFTALPALVDGSSYTLSARAMDSSNNWSGAVNSVFTYDATAPLSAVVQPASVQSATFTYISGTAFDAHGLMQVQVGARRVADAAYWNGSVWASTPAWNLASGTTVWLYAGISSAALSDGATYQFMARAYDAAGNVSDPFASVSTFTLVIPPEGVFSPAPFSGIGAAALTVNWGTTYPAGKLYYVRLSSHSAATPSVGFATATASAYAFGGLAPNARYYGFVSTMPVSGFLQTGSAVTLAVAPSSAAFSGVAYSSAALTWAAGGNPAGTGYQYEVAVSSSFGVIASSGSGTAAGGWLTGLAQGATYYGRVRAINGEGTPTAYAYASPAVTRALLPTGLAAGLAGSVFGGNSIIWSWTSGTLAAADYLAVYHNGVFAGTVPYSASGTDLQEELAPNTAHTLGIAGRNSYGEGPLALSAPVYTNAAVPAGLAAQRVDVSSAVLAWTLNGNSAGTTAQLWRSADNVTFSSVFTGAALSYTDTSVEECSTYYYKARNRNGAGVYTGYTAAVAFTTQASTPAAPSGLYAEALNGARIALAWDFSPWPGVTQYNLYYDNATGAINYASPYAVFTATGASYVTPALAAGSSYKFGLRAVNRCGIEEKNTTISASAQAVGVLSGVRAAIKAPQTGKKIKGNSVTIVAEIILGLPSQIKQVRFQYRLAGAVPWTDVAPANANHSNPDTESPYFVHWDADAMAPGTYELRALATDIYNTDDPAPPVVTVVIDPVDYDTNETVSGGVIQKEQKINNAVTSTVQAADDTTALLTKLVIPPGAVDVTTVAVTLVANPASRPVPPSGSEELSLAVKINLSSGQSLLSGGKTAAVTLSYKDDNGDGIVDGTNAPLDRLRMYSAPDGGGAWTEMATSVDREKKTISGVTAHFSFFSVFASPSSTLGGIKAYPNPWQPGAGGRFDAAAGITFANVPTGSRIKIFTIMGELVRQLEVTAADANTKLWDGRNAESHKAASGVYIVLVKSGSADRTFKIAVER
ncbi:MAG: hypothetical protein A2X31_00075 [Elusimicrobia bacterium GWB2_63_22]|nr:MAG: hypothetical protein A2X31_00075 [Elusimicrobia bacterium GWB2_63_22]